MPVKSAEIVAPQTSRIGKLGKIACVFVLGSVFGATVCFAVGWNAGLLDESGDEKQTSQARQKDLHNGASANVSRDSRNDMAPSAIRLALEAVTTEWGTSSRTSNLAVARAETVNMAIASFIQSRGMKNAEQAWMDAEGGQEHYILLAPFLAFAPAELEDYMPDGYGIAFSESLLPPKKVALIGDGRELDY